MFNAIKNLFRAGVKTDYARLLREGATILDVRSVGEYNSGHINGSVNIPLDELKNNSDKLKDKNRTIIACCASGMRSAAARAILKSRGYTSVYNGGAWSNLQNKL